MVTESLVEYKDGDLMLEGILYQPKANTKAPGILVYPAFWGPSEHEKSVAKELAELGFVALVADPYGKGVRPKSREEAFKIVSQFFGSREDLLKPRIIAAYNYLKQVKNVDTSKICSIGYCFGGTCTIDLARHNVDIKLGVSFHGAFSPTKEGQDFSKLSKITTELLICHGDADDHVNPTVPTFLDELRARDANFTFVRYSKAPHGFTMTAEPGAPGHVAYNQRADKQSKQAMLNLLDEVVGIPNKKRNKRKPAPPAKRSFICC
ncbi:unnamed protein product [Bursaphelenchus okinawaensis]|uniref:Dienelactone hydrolase domain-containing protein n=1 Tax=Bursaphelenchus okinawaensis TaxID=465554 RepID=A0A811KBF6_9BILA|nr:unnamed protein product [Bursaphelenchus okinawaensis]CAG9099123.1 unnamed protein product [Bursaphelenchus okinawaensis]